MDQQEAEVLITKRSNREQIWKYMMKNDLLNYPKKVYNKIPNFKGAIDAVERFCELKEFKDAKLIQISLDRPLEYVQKSSLKAGKEIIVPIPKLNNDLFIRVPPPIDGKIDDEHFRVPTRQQRLLEGQSILKIDDKINIDIVVIGSVCVDRNGHRIGKGLGFADLEFAMMMKMGAIKPETIVVTIVHDSQIVDDLPDHLFKKHDVHVDIIVTPTQTIIISNKLKKPDGIYWDILTQRRINAVRLLQQMKELDEKDGKVVVLKEEDPNDTPIKLNSERKLAQKRAREFRKNIRKPKKSEDNTTEDENKGKENNRVSRKRQPRPRKINNKTDRSVDNEKFEKKSQTTTSAPPTKTTSTPTTPPVRKHRSRVQIDYTLKLSKIRPEVRIRDVKNALNERGVKPIELTWRSQRGICYLHFGKIRGKEAVQDESISIDSIIDNLQKLKVGPTTDDSNENDFIVVDLVTKPVTKIEIVNATSA